MTLRDSTLPENARTLPTEPHYTDVLARDAEVAKERADARAADQPQFLATYTYQNALHFRRCIYALIDPRRPMIVMYVGQTICHPLTRLDGHIAEARRLSRNPRLYRCPRAVWLVSLLQEGVTPSIAVLEVVAEGDDLGAAEHAWIRFFRFRDEAPMNGQFRAAGWYGLGATEHGR